MRSGLKCRCPRAWRGRASSPPSLTASRESPRTVEPGELVNAVRALIAAGVERRLHELVEPERHHPKNRFATVEEEATMLPCKPQRVYDLLTTVRT